MQAEQKIYLDYNATTAVTADVKLGLLKALDNCAELANPSSVHFHGQRAKRLVAQSRESIARSLGNVDSEQIIFTSSGSEANQTVIRSTLLNAKKKNPNSTWVLSSTEHDSVMQMKSFADEIQLKVIEIAPTQTGELDYQKFFDAITPDTALISLIWVNNETGVMLDLERVIKDNAAKLSGVYFHLDAAQAWGKIPIDLKQLNSQIKNLFVTFSGHKIGALSGTGLIYVSYGSQLSPLILGKQEKGRRGGSENLLGIFSMGLASDQINPRYYSETVGAFRDEFENRILTRISGSMINGGTVTRVSNTSNLSFEGIEGDGLVLALDSAGLSVSSGSACSSGVLEPSHVLLAMGKTKLQAMSAVRVSFGRDIDRLNMDSLIEKFCHVVERVRKSKIL